MAARKRVKSLRKEENSVNPLFHLLKKPKVFIPLITVIVFGLLFYFRGLFVVAMVNGQPITRIALIQRLEKEGGRQTLSSLVTQTLILQEARRQNIDVDKKEIDKEAKEIENSLAKQGQRLDELLKAQGVTRKDFLHQVRIQKLVEKMLAKDIKVADKEVSDYIEKNKGTVPQDMKPEEVTKSARQQLTQQKLSSKLQPWLEKLQKQAKIYYFVQF